MLPTIPSPPTWLISQHHKQGLRNHNKPLLSLPAHRLPTQCFVNASAHHANPRPVHTITLVSAALALVSEVIWNPWGLKKNWDFNRKSGFYGISGVLQSNEGFRGQLGEKLRDSQSKPGQSGEVGRYGEALCSCALPRWLSIKLAPKKIAWKGLGD